MKVGRSLLLVTAIVTSATRLAFAHHGKDFLLVESYDVPEPGDFYLISSAGIFVQQGEAALDLEPALLVFVLPLLVYVGLLGLGVGIVASSLTTKYRDLTYVIGFATQLWMYASPIIYPLSQIPERWRWLFMFNPMTAGVEAFRWFVFGQATLSWALVLSNAAVAAILLLGGVLLFSRAEKTSMDTV